ncbi:MFS transporter [Teichococcus aestuarii]|uniref:MFS transporter n=1 Tax=Teichococcus aestuarii TaxID=568898 RepID=UPI003612670D
MRPAARDGNLVAAGFALTALTYGLGRFAYGLLLPQLREALSLGTVAAGWIGGGAFAAYCAGVLLAALGGDRLGERGVAVLAGLTATAGLGLVALAPSVPVLGAALALAGLSTGLTSPPLASAVARRFAAPARPSANGTINAGTAAGIVLSGAAALAFAAAWRELYALFALAGAGVTAWLWFAVPPGRDGSSAGGPAGGLARPGLAPSARPPSSWARRAPWSGPSAPTCCAARPASPRRGSRPPGWCSASAGWPAG